MAAAVLIQVGNDLVKRTDLIRSRYLKGEKRAVIAKSYGIRFQQVYQLTKDLEGTKSHCRTCTCHVVQEELGL